MAVKVSNLLAAQAIDNEDLLVISQLILGGEEESRKIRLADLQALLSAVESVNGLTGTVVLDSDNIVEGQTNLYFTNAKVDTRIALQKGAASGLATLDASSLVPVSQLPASSLANSVFSVASEAAQLLLTVIIGDITLRTDSSKTYVNLTGNNESLASDWLEVLATPNTHVHSAVDLTSGFIADARIASSSVLQYESLFDHDALLNFAIGEHRIINDAGVSTTELWSASKIDTLFAAIATGLSVVGGVATSTTDEGNITLSGEQTLNGLLTSAFRVLVTEQTDATENGVYLSAAGAWSRTTDMDQDAEVTNGVIINVLNSGSTKFRYKYILVTPNPITVGVTDQNWEEFRDILFGSSSGTATEGNDSRVPLQDEKDALVGTNGTPAVGNKFVTNSDPRNTDARAALSHALDAHSPSTLAELSARVSDATLIGTADSRILLQNENDAAAGTNGIPSSGNKFVTNSDPRNTDSRTPTGHAASHIGGADPIQDATASVKGLATPAQIAKLDAIELLAKDDQTDLEIETAYNAQVSAASQAEAVDGVGTDIRRWTPERVAQAITFLLDSSIPTYAEQVVIFQKQTESLGFVDKLTGFQTKLVAGTGFPSVLSGNALAFGPDNQLYFSTGDVGFGLTEFATIDLETGDYNLIAIAPPPPSPLQDGPLSAMDFHPDGRLIGHHYDGVEPAYYLADINLQTAAPTNVIKIVLDISTGGIDAAAGFAINPDLSDPRAYILVQGPGSAPNFQAFFYSIDLDTGAATKIGDTLYNRPSTLSFDRTGVLYSIMRNRGNNNLELVTINTDTGVATSVGRTFLEEQYPGASNFAVPGMAIRRVSTAASESSLASNTVVHEYGIVDAYKAAIHPPPPTILVEGMEFGFMTSNSNAGASMLDLNNKGADAFVNRDGSALGLGDILADISYRVYRNQVNTQWILLNPGS